MGKRIVRLPTMNQPCAYKGIRESAASPASDLSDALSIVPILFLRRALRLGRVRVIFSRLKRWALL
jgi:hypothetical protein